jgi:two-component system, chemotaxis family, CheB/CheR fusion protein
MTAGDGSPGGARPGVGSPSEDLDDELEELLRFIRDSRGFDFTGYKRPSVSRRVYRRARELGFDSLTAYRDVLEADVDEFTTLFNTVLINLTGFFRDPAAWRYLEHEIVPQILSRRDDDQLIRLWSAGCATGEEAYTLAMVLANHLGTEQTARRVKIYATDIDLDALTQARAAVYSEKSLRDVPEDLREVYFEPDGRGRGWVITPELRRTVVFGRLDLTRDPPISRVDLVACRNTLMYLNSETQAYVIPRLQYALRDDGFLFLGRAEMVLRGGAGRFAPVSLQHRIFVALPQQQAGIPGARDEAGGRPFDVGGFELPQVPPDTAKPEDAEPAGSLVAELLVDPEGLLTGANDLARQLFGIGADDMARPPGERLGLALESLDLEVHVRQSLVERMSHRVGLTQYEATGGESLNLEVWVLPLFDENEKVLGAAVIFADVGSTLQLRESFRHVHEELETAYEELQSTNEELVTSNEELQSSYEELETSNEELQSANEELETTNEELRSSYEQLETTNLELKTVSDAVGRLNETLVDANLELRRFSSLHRQVMDHLPSAVIVLNSHLLVEEWNEAATELWGIDEGAVAGEPFFGLDFGLPLGNLQEPVRACRSAGAVASVVEVQATDRSGRTFTCRVQVMPISGREPETAAMLVMDRVEGPVP